MSFAILKALAGKPEDKKPAPKHAPSRNVIISENSLVQELEDTNSTIYQEVLNLLTGKKFKLTEEQAVIAIRDFTEKVNVAHYNETSARQSLKNDKIGKSILEFGLKEMNNLITINY